VIATSPDGLSGALRSPHSDTPRRASVRCRASTRSDLLASIFVIFGVHGVEGGAGWALGRVEDAAAEREPALGADRTGGVDGFGKRDARPEEVPRHAVCRAQLRFGGPRASVAADDLRGAVVGHARDVVRVRADEERAPVEPDAEEELADESGLREAWPAPVAGSGTVGVAPSRHRALRLQVP
jgi:hypothetical protein